MTGDASTGTDTPRLAISAGSFLRPSETFLRRHASELAPGRTVLLCHDGQAPRPDQPVFRYRAPRFRGLGWTGRLPNAALRRMLPGQAVAMTPRDHVRAAAFLRRHGVDRVLAEYGPEGLLLVDLCDRLGLPLFVHFHGFDASMALRNPRYVRHYRAMFPRLAGVIVPSRYLARNLSAIGCPDTLLHVNPCGVDPDRFTPQDAEPGRVVAVGRLVPKKAPHLTIRAFALAAAEHAEARLEIIGDGPLRSACEAEVARHGLEGRVALRGTAGHEAVVEAVSRAHVFVQHSVVAPDGDTEGLPVAVLEAMSAARPVVATRHSGIPEAVEDGVTGLLVPEHDAEAMGRVLSALLADPGKAQTMGAAGRERVLSQFSHERSEERLRRILGL